MASSQFENKGEKRGGEDGSEPSELENCWVIEDRHRLKQKKKKKQKKRKGKREKIHKHENISSLKPWLKFLKKFLKTYWYVLKKKIVQLMFRWKVLYYFYSSILVEI